MPYEPLVVTTPDHDDQRLFPALEEDGRPSWEPGDGNVAVYQAGGLGSCRGGIGNERAHSDIHAQIYLTDARMVVVCKDWAKGAKYRAAAAFGGPVVSPAVANVVSQARATRRTRGQYLVGQMRYPWISRVAYSIRQNSRTENSVRVIGRQKTAFGDFEVAMLVLHLDKHADSRSLADDIVRRAIADRIDFTRTTAEERSALASAAWPDPGSVEPGMMPSVHLAGAFIVTAGSAYFGTASCRSERASSA